MYLNKKKNFVTYTFSFEPMSVINNAVCCLSVSSSSRDIPSSRDGELIIFSLGNTHRSSLDAEIDELLTVADDDEVPVDDEDAVADGAATLAVAVDCVFNGKEISGRAGCVFDSTSASASLFSLFVSNAEFSLAGLMSTGSIFSIFTDTSNDSCILNESGDANELTKGSDVASASAVYSSFIALSLLIDVDSDNDEADTSALPG
jgi:hypothetical protein